MTPKLLRVALYARVSTNHGQDPEMQLRELREYAASRGWEIAEEYTALGIVRIERLTPSPQPSDGRRAPTPFRWDPRLETESFRQVAEASRQRARRI
jgi:hypothetical protein